MFCRILGSLPFCALTLFFTFLTLDLDSDATKLEYYMIFVILVQIAYTVSIDTNSK